MIALAGCAMRNSPAGWLVLTTLAARPVEPELVPDPEMGQDLAVGPATGSDPEAGADWRRASASPQLATTPFTQVCQPCLLDAVTGEKAMSRREELLAHLWKHVININARDSSLDNVIANCKRDPNGPFGDTGSAIERMLTAGASRRDLCLVLRATAYEAVFGALYSLSDPGSDEDDDVGTLYEELLMAEPSGTGGRPGSADIVEQ
jgi:hypothetical protein